MPELFFFNRNLLKHLPKAERSKYQSLLNKVALPTGRPFFLGDNALPDRELDGFCRYLLAPRRASAHTWSTYASQIAVFLRFMEAQGKSWKDACRADLNLYYTVRTTGEFQDGPVLRGQSWNVAKASIVHLYEYALDEGYIEQLPFKYRKSGAQFGGKAALTADLGAKVSPEPINFISISQYKSTWRPYLAERGNAQRNLALTDLLITAGLRISEALALQVHQIPDPDDTVHTGRKSVGIRVTGKGKKTRLVRVPKRIVRAIQFYIEEDRAEAINLFRNKHKKTKHACTSVFLSQEGTPLSARSVQSFFGKASKTTGIRLTPHGCRHTFAIYQLEAMIKRMAKNLKELKQGGADAYRQILNDPLRDLQHLLGHSLITTTYIYLDFLEESEALVDESLNDWADWENSRAN